MKSNIRFSIQCDFPVLWYRDMDYRLAKSRKISLPAYMMLVYIKGAPGDALLCREINAAGIDSELYDIFSDELFELTVHLRMIQPSPSAGPLFKAEQYRDRFEKFKVSDFSLTQRGEIFFRDRIIQDGYETRRLRNLYYDFVSGKFSMDLALTNHAVIPFDELSGKLREPGRESIADYLNSIRKELKLGDDASVVDLDDCFDSSTLNHKEPINIELTQDGALFTCIDDAYLEFITRHYKPEWISRLAVGTYGKFGFSTPPVSDYKSTVTSARKMIFPKDIGKVLGGHCDCLIIGRNIFSNKGSLTADKIVDGEYGRQVLDKISPDCEFIKISGSTAYSYHAVNLQVPRCGLKGVPFSMDVLVEKEADCSATPELLNCIQKEENRLVLILGDLVRRECAALGAIIGQPKSISEIHLLANHAKMNHLIAQESAKKLESLNRTYKLMQKKAASGIDAEQHVIDEWTKVIVELEKLNKKGI